MLFCATLLLFQSFIHAQSTPSAIQVVTVGQNGLLAYSPDTITAAVGSNVEFQFYGPVHSVVQASFDQPCSAYNNGTGFFGGLVTTGTAPNPKTFTLAINDTTPIWFYCAYPGHCQAGMVGVINPSSNTSESLAIFKTNAANTLNTTTPAQQQGGVFGPFIAATNSSLATPSTSSASSTIATSSTSSTTSAKPSTGDASQRQGEFAMLGGLAIAAAVLMM
ncbi:Cupredoxin [Hyaloscypha finlandica]|nr:Cupredoxin [Hyaloscypha finlandica]